MEEINFYTLLRYYASKWLSIVGAAVIGLVVGFVYTFCIQQPQYTSTATLLLTDVGSQRSVVMNNYVTLFSSQRVLDPVIQKTDYAGDYASLVSNITAKNVKNTDIINLSITTNSSTTSQSVLEAAISEFKTQTALLYGDTPANITIVDAPNTSKDPANINPVWQIGLAAAAAAVLAIIVLFFIYDYKRNQLATKRAVTSDQPKI